MIRSFKDVWPKLGEGVFVDASAQVIGSVELGEHASVWMNAVVRGDVNTIRIGARTNIQDNCVVHVDHIDHATTIGEDVTVGHSVTLHGCTVEGQCLIGIGAVVLNGARIGSQSIIAAGSLVPEGTDVPPGSLVMGVPGKVRRVVTEAERAGFLESARLYVEYKDVYLREGSAAGSAS